MIDLVDYLVGDGRQYDVTNTWNGSSERMQTQRNPKALNCFYHVKNSNWEELWYTDKALYRGTDTSPGNNEVYQLSENGKYGSLWSPRFIEFHKPFKRVATVTFKNRDSGIPVPSKPPYVDVTWLNASRIHSSYRFDNNIVLSDVLELRASSGLFYNSNAFEIYLYAKKYGLVGWIGQGVGRSAISNDFGRSQPDLSRLNLSWLVSPNVFGDLPSASKLTSPPKSPAFLAKIPVSSDKGWQDVELKSTAKLTNVREYPTTASSVVGGISAAGGVYSCNRAKAFNDGSHLWYPVKSKNWIGWVRSDVVII